MIDKNKIKLVILAGGLGSRLSEETQVLPKPLVEIGGMPIIWHIMNYYSYYGINNFIVCCGYKGHLIKDYFANYFIRNSDITFDLKNDSVEIHKKSNENWKVTLVDTGLETMTAGRIRRVKKFLSDDEIFCLTYGDGLSDIDINKLIAFHIKKRKKVTLTAVKKPGRYGSLSLNKDNVINFMEKPLGDNSYINGGFFVTNKKLIDHIKKDSDILEEQVFKKLSKMNQISAFKHDGFWQSMDTLHEKKLLNNLWNTNKAPWKKWK